MEGWRQILEAAQHSLSTVDPSSLQSITHGQIKQENLATEPACAPPRTQPVCTQTSKGVSLTWDASSLFGIAWPDVAVALLAFHFTFSKWTQFTAALIQLIEQKNNIVTWKDLQTSALPECSRKHGSLVRFWAVVVSWAQPCKPNSHTKPHEREEGWSQGFYSVQVYISLCNMEIDQGVGHCMGRFSSSSGFTTRVKFLLFQADLCPLLVMWWSSCVCLGVEKTQVEKGLFWHEAFVTLRPTQMLFY